MIAVGLYAQAQEFLAVHRQTRERPFWADAAELPNLRMDRWRAWVVRPNATPRRSASPDATGDVRIMTPTARIVRVKPGPVHWRPRAN